MPYALIPDDVFQRMISRIADGEPLKPMLKEFGIHPMAWIEMLTSNSNAADIYARAQQLRTETYVDEMIVISDTEPCPNRARNMIQTRQWVSSKLNPRKYGDRLDVNITQTVDIGSALLEARARSVNQTLEISGTKQDEDTGLEPVAPQIDTDDDIFS